MPSIHHHKVAESFQESLDKLGVDYVDLYLIHWPQAYTEDNKMIPYGESPTYVETWRDMEKLLGTGKVRSIGVSNFSVALLEVLLKETTFVPATNQVEMHPFLPQNKLKAYCDAKGIHLTAYAPLGMSITQLRRVNSGGRVKLTDRTGGPPPPIHQGVQLTMGQEIPSLLDNDVITQLAEKYNVTTGQILLNWSVQRGTSVVPKSEKEERLRKNFTVSPVLVNRVVSF